ncbi:hypothetical protein LOC71_10355 [Rhodopirellula sp. JC740]|uniref:Secreted protein n=1 Tax=Rhodopirellula halodulae TaxID=2894198 RepID=A0ABS8NGI7_9BACT|nr:hypothetical protein [Rhodopirellula sp. JC740]MCC9642678.1 hypothetical protein [Rhodopirellula sp. JC740]
MKMQTFALAACFVLTFQTCYAEEYRHLERLRTPSLEDFKELDKEDAGMVVGWMRDIESLLLASSYEVRVVSEMLESTAIGTNHSTMHWRNSFRIARDPSSARMRVIVVRQNLLDNAAIATSLGIARDSRQHLDILRDSDKCYQSQVVAFENSTDEQTGECDWKHGLSALRLRDVFSPCLATTVGSVQTANGSALDFSRHNVRVNSVHGVIQRRGQTHVLLRFKGANWLGQLIAFENQAPIQMIELNWCGVDESLAKVTSITRSEWTETGPSKQRLPTTIYGISYSDHHPVELFANIRWKLGDEVDKNLFKKSTLGSEQPGDKQDFGIPINLR